MGRKQVKRRRRRSSTSSDSNSSSCKKSFTSRNAVNMLWQRLQKLERQQRTVSTTPPLPEAPTFTTTRIDETLIPEFNPSADGENVISWVNKVEELMVFYKWDSVTTLKIAVSRLRGHAKGWYESLPTPCFIWSHLKTKLLESFPCKLQFGKLLVDAATYVPLPNQKLSEYCFEKVSRLNKLRMPISTENIIDAVIEGINDEGVKMSARAAKFNNLGELANYLDQISITTVDKNNKNELIPTSSRNNDLNVRNTNLSKRKFGQKLCFICKGPHLAKFCTQRKTVTCSICGKLGHHQFRCYKRDPGKGNKSVQKQQNINMALKIEPELTENVYTNIAMINGVEVNCLLDTGSSCTMIKKSVLNKLTLKAEINDPPVFVKCFMGNIIRSNEFVFTKIKIHDVVNIVRIIVLPDELLQYDLIVGNDYLNKANVLMIKHKNKLILVDVADDVSKKLPTSIYTRGIQEVLSIQVTGDTPASSKSGWIESSIVECGGLDTTNRQQLLSLLNQFRAQIALSMAELGKTNVTSMQIKCKTEEPVVYQPYRMSFSERQILKSMIDELLDNNIIRESTSSYASPVLLVKKKTNDYRMCVDYRRLNSLTIKERYPLPRIEDQINALGGNSYFICLDLASGFYQLPMSDDGSIEKTAFITPDNHYEFLRMPFGLANSPAVFQRLINKVLGKHLNKIAYAYIDDIIIPSNTIGEGLQRLEKVLNSLKEANLTLKLSKCAFFKTSIEYLGQEISINGVRPGQRKIEAVKQMPNPTNVREVRQFLGLSGYFRKFVKSYATIVEPLTRLTKKNTSWEWTTEQDRAVQTIKEIITTRPVLAIFDPTLETELHTDACSLGFGGILFQIKNNEKYVVGYFSKQTTPEQRQYHSYELETLAVVLSLRYFRVFLLGMDFKVFTDCSALRTTFTKRDLVPRVGRWWLEVQDYTFEVIYRPGTRMCHVDALSRAPMPLVAMMEQVCSVDLTNADWILAAQLEDEKVSSIRKMLLDKNRTDINKQYYDNYILKNGRVYRKFPDSKCRWLVPKRCRWQICKLCHDEQGHFALDKTLTKITQFYWFPQMRQFVKKYIASCLNCLYYKKTSGKGQGMLHPVEKVVIPFHTLHIDHVGPFETSKKGNKYLLVIVDGFTKFLLMEPVKDTSTKRVTKVLFDMICLFGVPTRIISDRGSAFTSTNFEKFCKTYGIKHILNAVATPRANGQCERFNRTILNALCTTAAGSSENKWDNFVKPVQSAINNTVNKATGVSPIQALAGYTPRNVADSKIVSEISQTMDRLDLNILRAKMKDSIDHDQIKQKERYDRRRAKARKYGKGALVMVLKTDNPPEKHKKLLAKYKGPFRVTAVLPNDRYEVEDLRENFRRRKTVIAVDKLKPWVLLRGKRKYQA